jgi:hypothetical protein
MKINVKRLDHLQICIPFGQEQCAKEFYLNLLGGVEIEKPKPLKENGGFWFQFGNVQVHIGVERMEATKSKRHPAFEIDELTKVKTYLEKNGVMTKEETQIRGMTRFSFFDPFQNRIEFLQKK